MSLRRRPKKYIATGLALLLLLAALLLLCGCSQEEELPYRVIKTVSEPQYGSAFRLDDPLAEQVSAAISVLAAEGKISSLSTDWLGKDLSCLDGDAEALDALENQPEARTFTVGVYEEFRPLSYSEDDGYAGMTVDLARAIGEKLGWTVKIQPISPADLSAQLASGNIDCALGFDIAGIDAEKFAVGEVYMTSEIVLAVPVDSDIKKVRQLEGLKIGSVKGSPAIDALKADEDVVKYANSVTAYLTPLRCISALSKGWCAAVAMDAIALEAYFK